MELVNDFTVNVPVDEAWTTLTDVERIAPCMPGAQLQEIEGDTYRGIVKVKVGPITAQFKGEANFVEQDETAHRAVLKAAGRDTGGKGNASALITAQLEPAGDTTHVTVSTDLTITGKVAQFGRGALADVSTKLLRQFVDCLESTVLAQPAPATTTMGVAAPSEATAAAPPTRPGGPSSGGEVATAAATASQAVGPSGGETVTAASAPSLPGAPSSGGEVATAAAAAPHWSAPATAEPEAPGGGAGVAAGDGDGGTTTAPTKRTVQSPEAAPLDLLASAGGPIAKRLVPVALLALIVFLLVRRARH